MNPFEDRQSLGFFTAYLQTLKMLFRWPRNFFAQTEPGARLSDALFFAAISGFLGTLFETTWNLYLGPPTEPQFPSPFSPEVLALFQVVFSPLATVLGVVVLGSIFHFFLILFGSGSAGWRATVQALGYSTAAQVLLILPKIGGFLSLILSLVFLTYGLQTFHRSALWRVVLALLLPLVLFLLISGFYLAKVALLMGPG